MLWCLTDSVHISNTDHLGSEIDIYYQRSAECTTVQKLWNRFIPLWFWTILIKGKSKLKKELTNTNMLDYGYYNFLNVVLTEHWLTLSNEAYG